MALPRFKGVPRVSTVETTREDRFEFGYEHLCAIMKLPPGAALTVEVLGGDGIGREVKAAYDLGTGHVFLVATVKVTK